MKIISCIICAYNEGPRISSVLEAVADHPLLSEVIVVDDGSQDNTAEVVRSFPSIQLISYPQNAGKTKALLKGLEASSGDTLLFLDADLKGIGSEDIGALIQPVLNNSAQVSVSLRKNSLFLFRLIELDFVSGERVVPKAIFHDIRPLYDLPPFGIEAWMNDQIIKNNLKIKVVRLKNVSHARKMEKTGWWRGKLGEFKTALDVLRVISLPSVLRQQWKMLKLSREK